MRLICFLTLAALALVFPIHDLAADQKPIRFGLMSDVNSLPFLVADAEGLFSAHGVTVQLTQFKSAVERDAAFQAGALDGIVGDILGAAFAADNGFAIGITSLTDGRFGLVTSPGSGIKSVKDLANQGIGTSTNTIIHYFIDSVLKLDGLKPAEIRYVAVPNMPLRLEMLLNGQLKAVGLPEPLLTVAQARGATLVADSQGIRGASSVVLFSRPFIDSHLSALKAFYAAYAVSAARINANNAAYRDFLIQKAGFPAEVKTVYRFVRYAPPHQVATTEVEAVLAWLRERRMLKTGLVADSLLDSRALVP